MFSLSADSNAELGRLLSLSALRNPVFTLVDTGRVSDVPSALAREFLEGNDSTQFQQFVKHKADESLASGAEWTLNVDAHNRAECLSEDVVEIGRFSFAMSSQMRAALTGYTLEFRSGRFFLEASDDCAGSLSAVRTLAPWFASVRKPPNT